jgi:hypothetical protein
MFDVPSPLHPSSARLGVRRAQPSRPPNALNLQPFPQPTLDLPSSPSDSSFIPQPSSLATTPWPADLPSQVLAIRHLLPAHGPNPAALSALFGRKSARREAQIRSILATLEALGKIQ